MDIRKLEEYMSIVDTYIARLSVVEDDLSKKADINTVLSVLDERIRDIEIRLKDKGIDL